MTAVPVDTMSLAHDERADLAEMLATLTPSQWESPTLCPRWRVRDVVAHVFGYDDLGMFGLIGRFVRGGLHPDRVNAVGVAAYVDRSTDDLLTMVTNHLQPRGLTAGFGGRIALTDGLIHHQDIRRSLGWGRTIPADRLVVALQFARTAPLLHAAKRIRGLTLTATDIDWTTGEGPGVEGPGEAVLMAIAGRADALTELAGAGLPTLVARINVVSTTRPS